MTSRNLKNKNASEKMNIEERKLPSVKALLSPNKTTKP